MNLKSPQLQKIISCLQSVVVRRVATLLVVVLIAFTSGFTLGKRDPSYSFHDMIVSHQGELPMLVNPRDKRISALAESLKSPEKAFEFVRDRIVFDPSLPSASAGDILAEGRGSCLGKAVLLCSLYRAMGMSAKDVRIVTGEVEAGQGVLDHAWVELEHNGTCIQQDTTDLLGRFGFDQFRGMAYTNAFIRREGYTFNDKGFAIISRLNMMKGTGHPVLTKQYPSR